MHDPTAAFARWFALLGRGGTAVLIEGRWSTGAGLTVTQTEQVVRRVCRDVQTMPLTGRDYWGKDITDERYCVVAQTLAERPRLVVRRSG